MTEKPVQGVISTSGTKVLTAPSNSGVKLLVFTVRNSVAYTFTLTKYNKTANLSTVIYSLNLSAGDTVIDERTYVLNPGDYIQFTSSVPGTTYELTYFLYGTT
jgi:hypothetical protein